MARLKVHHRNDGSMVVACLDCGKERVFTVTEMHGSPSDYYSCDCSKQEPSLLIERVLVAREAGAVERCHTFPHHGKYTVAEHCYGVVSLLFLLYPIPSINLIKSCLWHDTAERFLGDLPAPTKWKHGELRAAYETVEEDTLKSLGFSFELTEEELSWVKVLDKLELWLWAQHQKAMGNRYIEDLKKRVEDWFDNSLDNIPEPVLEFIRSYSHGRLPDDYHLKGIAWHGYEPNRYYSPVEPKPTQRSKVDD